jgi:RimJ/RimL family protein N-acetyltransferase
MNMDLSDWHPRPCPERVPIEGLYTRLEPLDAVRHGDDLFRAAMAPGANERHRYLFEPEMNREDFQGWVEKAAASSDPMFWAVVDKATGLAQGRQALMRIDPAHGVIEVGSILWGPGIARGRVATEALHLFAGYAFDALGYRRFEWKCHDLNAPSKAAALRFGFTFEGIFRQHMVAKGANRDTAWFSIVDGEWPALKARCGRWLDRANFDAGGRQLLRLQDC